MSLGLEQGAVPEDLCGTLFRNGPGAMECFGTPYEHMFDGDGYVHKLCFDGSSIRFSAAFVKTAEFVRERERQRPMYRSFGTNLPGGIVRNAGRFRLKNAANTSVIMQGERLFALWEGGAPTELNPHTLQTIGRWHGEGVLRPRGPIESLMQIGRPYASHAKKHPDTGNIFTFGILPGIRQHLLLYQTENHTSAVPKARDVILPRLSFMHDFVLLDDGSCLFFDVPVSFRLWRMFAGIDPPAGTIVERGGHPTVIRLFEASGQQKAWHSDPCFVFHFANGYRREGELVVDALRLDHFPSLKEFRAIMSGSPATATVRPVPTRYRLAADGSVSTQIICHYACELPRINPQHQGRPYRYFWSVADPPERPTPAPMHGIARVDVETGEVQYADMFPKVCGEPVFIPRSESTSETDGYIVAESLDPVEEVSRVHVLDAETLSTLCSARLPEPIHLGFHGYWSKQMYPHPQPDSEFS